MDLNLSQQRASVTQGIENINDKFPKIEGKTAEVVARIEELEKKGARRGSGDEPSNNGPSIGRKFANDYAQDLERISNERGRVSMRVEASLADGGGAPLVVPSRDGIATLPQRRLTIRNLLTVVNVTSDSVEYPRQTTRDNSADMVAEGGLKPESGYEYDLATVPMRVLAHWTKASRQILSDAPQLASMIDVELRYGLALKEEAQLLYGNNAGQNLNGMVPQATEFDDTMRAVGDTKIDTIGRAILQASLTDIPPDGIVIHPADWWAMRLTKDADGKYILGDPMQAVTPNLFGLPVVATKAHNVGEFTVGNFRAQTLYDRWTARVEAGFVDDDFIRNLVTILGEERIGFAAKQPGALIAGQFVAA